jgi:zinc protease
MMQGQTLVQELTLDNGLQVLLWPDQNIPNIALHQWVRVGSRNEGPGTSGLAHFFEHMMFNGTLKHPRGDFDRLMESQGASNNAFTAQDVTVYQDWFPVSALEQVFELESDRFSHLQIVPDVVENERKVVYSERRLRVDDSNAALLEEQVQATAFLAHPYRIPTIGWPSDIQSWNLSQLRAFYETWYSPNNRCLILTGAFEPEKVFALAQKYFAAAPARDLPSTVVTREPEQRGERRLLLERPGQNPLVQVAWHAIAASDPQQAALNLLQTILVGGDASRLHRSLVEDQELAVAIGGGWAEGFDPNIFSIYATLPADGSVSEFESALETELARVLEDGVSEKELQRARNIAQMEFWRALSTIDGKARLLGDYAVMHGDYRLLFAAPERYQGVTRDQLRTVARQVFHPDRRTVGVLQPSAVAPA